MSITFNDFKTRNFLRHLEPIAGMNGMGNSISTANILDYEFSIKMDLDNPFDSECVIVSSLYFAEGREYFLLPAIKELNRLGVSGLIYETAVIETLPQEVLDYANEFNFPIFKFDRILGLENVVYDIIDAVKNSDAIQLSEVILDRAIWGELDEQAAFSITKSLSLNFKKHLRITYITRTGDTHKIDHSVLFKKFHSSVSRGDKHLIINYREGVFLFSTMESNDEKAFDIMTDIILEDILPDDPEIILARSDIHESESEFYTCIREAYFSSIVARIKKKNNVSYNESGLYKFIIPLKNDRNLLAFADKLLTSLQTEEYLLSTLSDYVEMDGDVNAVAIAQCCHPNTVRHRIKKAKDISGNENTNYYDFISEMSIAIRIMQVKSIF